MTTYIIRRTLILPFTLFGLTILIFGMISLLPLGVRAALYTPDIPKKPGDLARTIATYGLDDPIHIQYGRWIGKLLNGDLGFSQTGKESVAKVIFDHLPATAELALWAIVPIVFIGINLGVIAALRHNQPIDHVLRIFSIIGTSLPAFMAGLLLLMFFAVYLGWLPTGGRLTPQLQRVVDNPAWFEATGMYTVDSLLNGRLDVFVDALKHIVMPVVTLSYISWAILMRITRSSMLETLRQDYVNTARSKGLAESVVIRKHARPNAMLPVTTIAGAQLIGLLGGAPITETVFHWPGIGKRFVDAAANLDVITVLGFMMFSGTVLVVGNLLIDLLYAWMDPRVRYN